MCCYIRMYLTLTQCPRTYSILTRYPIHCRAWYVYSIARHSISSHVRNGVRSIRVSGQMTDGPNRRTGGASNARA